jgi:WD40 repeat protein/tetratricopeptide (TPR) repeat protein/serine/threonine protein kinase
MTAGKLGEEAIFNVARKIDSPEARGDYLNQVCAVDEALRGRVQALLQVHEREKGFLACPVPRFPATIDQPMAEGPGTIIGPYKLLQQIGEGGMGAVFMAEQLRPVRRKVALKVIKPGMDTHHVIARFEAERQALALMDHPHIARVLDAGATESARPYFVMELVRGIPITDYCDQNNLTARERLELFVSVCQAVQHAHQKGIIHRDIKPSNILVTLHDGTPVVKVIDFGIAKATGQQLTDKTLFTNFAQMVGTPLYMSPEQVEMSGLDIDTRTDIYSLGVLLYELLTGTTPFDKERLRQAGYDEIRRIIRDEEPPRPSTRISTMGQASTSISTHRKSDPKRLSQLFRGELDWIVMKALEKDRTRRYETASAFAADVLHYLHDEPVQACPPSAAYRFRKFARRNKVMLTTAGLVAVALVLGTIVSVWQAFRATDAEELAQERLIDKDQALTTASSNYQEAEKQKNRAVKNEKKAKRHLKEAEEQEHIARWNIYTAHLNLADQAYRRGDVGLALELLEGQRPGSAREDLRGFEWYYLWRLCHPGHRFTLRVPRSRVVAVAFVPDGTSVVAGAWDGSVHVWDAATGRPRVATILWPGGGLYQMALSPDGKMLASGNGDGSVTFREAATGLVCGNLPAQVTRVNSLAYSPDGKMLATASGGQGQTGELKLWDLASRQELATLAREEWAGLVAFAPDGKTLASAFGSGAIKLWDVAARRVRSILGRSRVGLNCLVFSPDGKLLASGGGERSVGVWNLATYKEQHLFLGQTSSITSVAFSSDSQLLAAGSWEGSVKLWDLATGQTRASYGHAAPVSSVAFSRDGKRLATAGHDRTVKIWDVPSAGGPSRQGHTQMIWQVVFSPDGKTLASTSDDKTIKLWHVATGRVRATLRGHSATIRCAAFSPEGKLLASGGDDGTIRLWEAATGRQTALLAGHSAQTVAFSPDGTRLASANDDMTVRVWDLATQQVAVVLKGHTSWVGSVAFSPDGKVLASAAGDETVRLWELATGRARATFKGGQAPVAFSRDGKALLSGAGDQSAALWDVATGKVRAALGRSSQSLASVGACIAVSPDWKTLAVGGKDGSVTLWDVATGQERTTLGGHTDTIRCLAFAPDGNTLAIGGFDGTVRLLLTASRSDVLRQSHVPSYQVGLAIRLYNRGDQLLNSARPADSEQAYRQALELYKKLAARFPAALEYREGVADSHSQLAFLLAKNDRPAEAEREYRRAQGCFERLAAESPANPEYRYMQATCRNNTGVILQGAKRPREAEQAYREAVDLIGQLLAEFPHSAWYRRELARDLGNLARLLAETRQPEEAKTVRQRQLEVLEGLVGNDPQGYWMRAKALADRGQWRKAVADYTTAIKLRPNEPYFWSDRAGAHVELGQLEKAIADYSKALELDPGDVDSWINRGRAYYRLGQWEKSVADCSKAIELQPNERVAWSNRAIAYNMLGRHDKAIADSQRAIKLDPNSANAHNTLGNSLDATGRYAEAIAAYRQAVKLAPDIPQYLFNLALVITDCPDPKFRDSAEAVRLAKRAVDLDPKDHEYWRALGAAHYRAGDWKAVAPALKKSLDLAHNGQAFIFFYLALAEGRLGNHEAARRWHTAGVRWMERDVPNGIRVPRLRAEAAALLHLPEPPQGTPPAKPDDVELYTLVLAANPRATWAHVQRGTAHGNAGRWRQAVADFSRATELSPKDAHGWYDFGFALGKANAFEEAIAAYRKAVDLMPDHAGAYNNLGNLLNRKGRFGQAITACRQAIQLDPDSPEPHLNLGVALGNTRRYAKAIVACRKAIDLKPDFFEAHYYLGVALFQKGAHDEAIASLRKAIEFNPNYHQAHNYLGWVLREKGRFPEAVAAYRKVLTLKPHLPEAHDNLGFALWKNGQLDEAIASYRQAIKLKPDYANAFKHLGMALNAKGQPAEAITAYRKAVALKPEFAGAHEGLAWMLAACPDPKFSNPQRVLEAARKAIQLTPRSAMSWQVLGCAYYRTGDWQASIQALEKSIELQKNGGDPGQWSVLALARWRLGQKEEARKIYARAAAWMSKNQTPDAEFHQFLAEAAELVGLPLPPEEYLWQARGNARSGQWEKAAANYARALEVLPSSNDRQRANLELARWDDVFDRLVRLRSNDPDLWIGRGRYFALRREWAQAAAAYARRASSQTLSDEHFEHGCVLLLSGDRKGYRAFCKTMLAMGPKNNAPPGPYVLARTFALAAAAEVPPARALEWAQQAANHDSAAWVLHALALAHYRAGHLDQAIERARVSNDQPWTDLGKAQNWLVLALSHARLGNAEEARQCWEAALPSLGVVDQVQPDEPLTLSVPDLLEIQVLRRQAEAEPTFRYIVAVRRLVGHLKEVQEVAYFPDGRRAISASHDGTLRLWDVATGRELRRFEGHRSVVHAVAISPDSRQVLSGSWDGTLRLWDVSTGQEARRFKGNPGVVLSVAFSPDGRLALSTAGDGDRSMRLWDVATGQELRRFEGHTKEIHGVAFSPDGRRALSGAFDKTMRLWEVETGRELRRFDGHTDGLLSVAFSPDGRRALSGGFHRDRTMRLWDLDSGQELRRFDGHTNGIQKVAFSPDGRHALTASVDATVRLWDVETGKEIGQFRGHQGSVNSVVFSPDGRQAISASHDRTLRLWRLPPADAKATSDEK